MLGNTFGVEYIIEEAFIEEYIPSSLCSFTSREATTEVMSIHNLTQLRLGSLQLCNLITEEAM